MTPPELHPIRVALGHSARRIRARDLEPEDTAGHPAGTRFYDWSCWVAVRPSSAIRRARFSVRRSQAVDGSSEHANHQQSPNHDSASVVECGRQPYRISQVGPGPSVAVDVCVTLTDGREISRVYQADISNGVRHAAEVQQVERM
jgi:hypothetical protein